MHVHSDIQQEYITFTYFPRIEQTGIANASGTNTGGGFGGISMTRGGTKESSTEGVALPALRRPITKVVPAGHYEDCEMPCGFSAHPQMNVRVGVIEGLQGANVRNSTGTLQILDEDLISGNKIMVLLPKRLSMPCQFSELPWPSNAGVIMDHS